MTLEQYEKLNEYLNECFLRLQDKHPIFLDNLKKFCIASDFICKSFEGTIESNHKQNNLTYEDVLLLAREIIEKINPNYLENFDNLVKSGILDFDYENEINDSVYSYIYSKKQGIIDVKRLFNYEDVLPLIHEFIHSTNRNDRVTYNRIFLTEFISICFEEFAKKYLIEEKKINVDEIGVNSRIISFLHMNKNFNKYCLVLLAYDNLGDITSNTPNEMKEILKCGDTVFEEECLEILNNIEKIEKSTFKNENVYNKVVELFDTHYKYIVGTLLAYYAMENCKMEDIVLLNDNINSEEYADMSIEEVLETIGIKLNLQFLNESIQCIKNNIKTNKVKK